MSHIFLEFAWDRLPYKDKHPVKGTDRPMRVADVETFERYFTNYHYRSFDLLFMLAKTLRLQQKSALRTAPYQIGNFMFDRVPYLQRYARFIVTCITK